MKKFLISFVVFALLVTAGAIAVMHLLSAENIRQQVVQKVKEATGRDLAFDAMSPAFFFPNVGLRLRNVKFSNMAGAHDKNMLELEELDLHLALQPLFHKQVEVAKLTLKKPVIHLEVGADGKASWDFSKGPKAEKSGGEAKSGGSGDGAASGFGFKFGKMQIDSGKLTYRDAKKGTNVAVDGVNVSLTWPEFKSALQADGDFTYKGKRVNLVLSLTKPMDLSAGKTSDGDFQVKTDGVTARITGNFASSGTFVTGKASLSIDSLTALSAWLAGGKGKMPFEKLNFDAGASVSETTLKLSKVKLKLDDLNADGDAVASVGGKPKVTGKFAVDHIDLDRFTAASKSVAAAEGKSGKSGQDDWDATPMNFGGLKLADADLTLNTQGFTVKGAEVGPSTLTALLNDGNLHIKSSEATLFGGKFSSDLTVNGGASTPTMALKFNMSGVQAKPALTAFANFKKLDGTAFATMDVTAAGNSQRAIINNMNGKATFDFKNGSIQGIDVAKLIQARLTDMNIGEGKTDFVDLGGTATIRNGIAHNDDLKMKGPLVQASGAGDVNLPTKSVKYRLMAILTASSAAENAKGLNIPVDISGPFSNIHARPDWGSMVKNVLGNPEDTKAAVQNIRTQGKDILKDLKKDPNKALNRLLGIPSPEPAPAPAGTPDGAAAPAPEQAPTPAPAPATP